MASPVREATAPSTTAPRWVVMLSGSPWHVAAHRQQAIARELSRDVPGPGAGYRVLFVDPPSNRTRGRFSVDRIDGKLWHATAVTPFPFGRQLSPANRAGRAVTARLLRRWLDARPGERLVWVDEDLSAPLIGRLGETAVVYDATDLDWTFTRRWNRPHLRRSMQRAVAAADLVLASSDALPARLPRSRTAPVVLANACDPQRFRPDGEAAGRLADLPRPLLGYLGAVDVRAFDAELVAAVARAHQEWTLALVGPSTAAGRAPLAGLPNVHLFDAVGFEEAPSVMRAFDVGLIPYRIGGLVDYVHPKKCYEYLATGLPVVATALPALKALDAPIRLAESPAGFAEQIAAALAEGHSTTAHERRRAIASANSWQVRGTRLRELLAELGQP